MATGNLVVLLGTGVVGYAAPGGGHQRHVALAVFALLLTCLIQAAVLTYLSIAGKVIAQAVHLARLDLSILKDVAHLKRSTTTIMALVTIAVVLVTATGADLWGGAGRPLFHVSVSVLLLAVHAGSFARQYRIVVQTASLLERVLDEYREVRSPELPEAKER
ncbi:MAG: hypothetical protein ACE5HE_14590 [Phycisphaerae bacterium]